MKFYDSIKRYGAIPIASGLAVVSAFPALAVDGTTVVTSSDWAPIIEAMTGQISVSTVVGVIATAIAAGIGLVFMWWGGRKAVRTLMSAFRKGKVSM
ncbi:hypothetical protein [Lacrimispora sp. 210928-DFI.3.58]|jgi:hypothetical protein|uniref:hypothetical protein n=1 Tax=Lacrimispora sp. 210928-DFI.3.58 TaxID=2883214 RepID=UPI001D06D5C3|nr:hypothetical protein [Lacrimispora sp. 210928-DFI.3.58]MCB7319110.1 hypothetical protein [Lacrimispora sp. 210928-DFI.3.58]